MFRLYTIFFDFVAVIYSDYPTTASYDELAKQIRNAGGVVNSEIRVKTDPNGSGYSTATRLLISITTSRG